MSIAPITHQCLLDRFIYDIATGAFLRRNQRGSAQSLSRADYLHSSGYRRLSIGGKKVAAHRVAWFYVTGQWPSHDIDHRNRDRADNSWSNLRPATSSQNAWNSGTEPGASGVKGVSWHKGSGAWRARCRVKKREFTLGYFHDIELAALVIQEFRSSMHGAFACHGKDHEIRGIKHGLNPSMRDLSTANSIASAHHPVAPRELSELSQAAPCIATEPAISIT